MICPKCNTTNDEQAGFCIQCGAVLPAGNYDRKYEDMSKSMILVLIMLGWELFCSVVWLFIQKAVVPLMNRGLDFAHYDRIGIIYKVTGLFLDIVSIALGVVFLILARHKGARALFIAYVVIRAVLLIIYRLTEFL